VTPQDQPAFRAASTLLTMRGPRSWNHPLRGETGGFRFTPWVPDRRLPEAFPDLSR
jgi:hypothetical protein